MCVCVCVCVCAVYFVLLLAGLGSQTIAMMSSSSTLCANARRITFAQKSRPWPCSLTSIWRAIAIAPTTTTATTIVPSLLSTTLSRTVSTSIRPSANNATAVADSILVDDNITTAPPADTATSTTTAATNNNQSDSSEPTFDILSNGLGSVVYVTVPPHSRFYARPGALIAQSPEVSTRITSAGNPVRTSLRMLAGGGLFLESASTGVYGGDAMISPNGLGDVALLSLNNNNNNNNNDDGTTTGTTGSAPREYRVRRGAFLAATPGVDISGETSRMAEFTREAGLFTLAARGSGQLAITSFGGLFRLSLEEEDVYYASTKHLVAWDAGLDPVPLAALRSAGETGLLRAARSAITRVRGWITGSNELCVLQGPGDFYLSSRVEQPLVSNLRQ